jgi:hypothetical protein
LAYLPTYLPLLWAPVFIISYTINYIVGGYYSQRCRQNPKSNELACHNMVNNNICMILYNKTYATIYSIMVIIITSILYVFCNLSILIPLIFEGVQARKECISITLWLLIFMGIVSWHLCQVLICKNKLHEKGFTDINYWQSAELHYMHGSTINHIPSKEEVRCLPGFCENDNICINNIIYHVYKL